MAIEKHEAVADKVWIWGETDNINHFVTTPLTPVSYGSVTNQQSQVKSHSRRTYPFQMLPPSVASHSRTYIVDPGRKNGSALPGSNFWVDDGTEKRQFTYQGDFTDLHAYFVGETKLAITLWSERGVRYAIAAPTP